MHGALRTAWLGLALTLGCESPEASADRVQPGPQAPPAAAPPPLRELSLLYTGCDEIRPGPGCVLPPTGAPLRVWVEVDPGFEPVLRLDGVTVDAPEAVEGGVRWVVRPNAASRRLELQVDLDGATGHASLALHHAPSSEHDEAPVYTAKGYARARDASRPLEASRIAQTLLHEHLLRYDEEGARRWLQQDALLLPGGTEQDVSHRFYEGLLAEYNGDPRAALRAYRVGGRQARALDLVVLEAATVNQQLPLLGRLGAWNQTSALQQRALGLEPRLVEPLHRAQLLNGTAWMLLETRARGRAADDPTPLLLRALDELGEEDGSTAQRLRDTIPLNLAYAAVLEQDAPRARTWLESVEDAPLQPEDRLWRELLQARLAWLESDLPGAQRRFETLLARSNRLREPELRWQATLGLGLVQQARGRLDAAVASFVAAERMLDEQLPRIAMGEGRASYVAERHRGAQRLIDLQLRRQRPAAALCTARLARTRALRTLARQLRRAAVATPQQRESLDRIRRDRARLEREQEDSWSLPAASARQRQRTIQRQQRETVAALDALLTQIDPGAQASCDDLSTPGPGELDLHYVDLEDGWVGVGVDAQGLTVHRLGPLELEAEQDLAVFSAKLLRPFAESIARAERIRVMPTGLLTSVPFHALPLPGDPSQVLLDAAPVRYGLDLPHRDREPAAPSRGLAVLVAPASGLLHAQAESDAVARSLTGTGWTVRRIEGDRARGDVVRAALAEADLVHYVGHAHSDDIGGWSSALSLTGDDTVDVSDVLALPHVPRMAVLNGCETGRSDPRALAGGMSLAHAFVLGGAELVVATDLEVDDAAAAGLIRAFYDALATGQPAAMALRSALRERRDHDETWLLTRAWVP